MLTIIRGLPGSGKSTYARTHFPGVMNIEQDMYFVVDGKYVYDKSHISDAVGMCKQLAKIALKFGADVVVSNTFVNKDHVDDYVLLAKYYNQPYQVIRLETKYKTVHDVPEYVYERMKTNFQDYPGEIVIK